ncbi:hypothetical protein D5045_09825 [Verminephrobacter eiseniae]|nr:hypothetical protein [Verminephrobacter eiseniae]
MKSLAVEIREPFDAGSAPLAAVHGMNCLRFLEEAHAEWKKMPPDGGDEVMSNIYLREGSPLRGVPGKAARYPASCIAGAGETRRFRLRNPIRFPRAPPGFTPMLRSGVAPIVGRHQQNCGAGSLDCLDDSAAVAPSPIAMVLARLHGTAPQTKGGAR